MADEPSKPDLTVVTLAQKPSEIAVAGDKLRRSLDDLVANQPAVAKVRRAAFLALVAEGFTEAQALELCVK